MFKDKRGDTIEVYINDMVVKSKRYEDHLRDHEEVFDILDEYNMDMNPSKYHFGMKAGKFLGYMVTKRRIEASLGQGSSNREPILLHLSIPSDAISAVLAKDLDGEQQLVYYVSKSLLDPETGYFLLEKLILALVTTSTKLRHYFETHTICVKTNYHIKNFWRKTKMS